MAVARRTAAPATPAFTGPNFGDLSFYSGSFVLPKGRYALEFLVKMHNPLKQDGTPAGKPRLGVMVTAHPLEGGDPMEQFLSMGSKADQSFMPSPDGKGLAPVPNAPSSTAPRMTNWNVFLKSLYDAGMPQGIFTNNISVLDGIHVQTDLIPEPEERKGFAQAQTGEAAQQQEERKGSGLIPVVSEILEGGKPWEGGGGIPDGSTPAAPAAAAAPAQSRAAAPAAPAAPASEDLKSMAQDCIADVLGEPANANGTSKLKLRTGTFKAAGAKHGQPIAQSIIDTIFVSDDALNAVLSDLGYQVVGQQVKPV